MGNTVVGEPESTTPRKTTPSGTAMNVAGPSPHAWGKLGYLAPEWSRNSCGPPVIILEQTAEPLATLDG